MGIAPQVYQIGEMMLWNYVWIVFLVIFIGLCLAVLFKIRPDDNPGRHRPKDQTNPPAPRTEFYMAVNGKPQMPPVPKRNVDEN